MDVGLTNLHDMEAGLHKGAAIAEKSTLRRRWLHNSHGSRIRAFCGGAADRICVQAVNATVERTAVSAKSIHRINSLLRLLSDALQTAHAVHFALVQH